MYQRRCARSRIVPLDDSRRGTRLAPPSAMSFTKAALLGLLAACSGPTRTEPTSQPYPTGDLPGESMPAPGDSGGQVPEPPPETTTPAERPGASFGTDESMAPGARRAEPRDTSQALVDAGVGRDASAIRDGGVVTDGGLRDAGFGGRDGGISVGGDAGVGSPR